MRIYTLLLLAACTDPAVEMHLVLPQPDAQIDLSCVTAVRLDAFGNDQGDVNHPPDVKSDCVDLPRAPTSLSDLAGLMHGKFSVPMPASGLLGVDFTAFGGPCSDEDPYEAMAYGGAPYTSKSLSVPLEPNISCTATTTYTVHPLDLLNAGACTGYTTGYVEAADIRPWMLGSEMPPMYADYGKSNATLGADGTGQVTSFNAILGAGCIAAAYYDNATSNFGLTCVSTTTPTLCGGAPGTVEVGVLPDLYYSYFDKNLAEQYNAPTYGTVWDIPTKTAIAGATVTVDEGGNAQVVYAEPGAGGLTTHDGPTGASGLFMVYARGAVAITVSAPGHASEHYIVAGTPQDNPSVIAALPKIRIGKWPA